MRINGIYLNNFFFIFIAGAFLLAAVYHTILNIQRNSKLLSSYSGYLWCTFLYCFYRIFFPVHDPAFVTAIAPDKSLDETLQMLAYLMYVRFIGIALNLNKETDRRAYLFVKFAPLVIMGYVLLQYALILFKIPFVVATIAAITIRGYMLIVGLLMLINVLKRRAEIFYNFLAAGAISMIFFGLISTMASFTARNTIIIDAPSLLMTGFFFDVIFFSAAIGYKLKEEAIEREDALKLVIQQQAELQLKELEQQEAVYQTQLRERLRIAKDLHDDIGATLSSISMYSDGLKGQLNEQFPQLGAILDKIGENSRDMVTSMSDIVWAINPDNDDGSKLLNRMENYATDICAAKHIKLHFTGGEELKTILLQLEQRKNLYLIFKESVNNAVKYADAKNLWVTVSLNGREIHLLVKDDGKGFAEATVKKGNGLKNMQVRAAELDGTLSISAEAGNGTSVSLVCGI